MRILPNRWQDVLRDGEQYLSQEALASAINNRRFIQFYEPSVRGDQQSDFVINLVGIIKNISETTTNFVDSLIRGLDSLFTRYEPESDRNNQYAKLKFNVAQALLDICKLENLLKENGYEFVDCVQSGTTVAATVSLMGAARLSSNNSDAVCCLKPEIQSPILAAVADGVTGGEADRLYSTGKIASKAVIEHLGENAGKFTKPLQLKLSKRDLNVGLSSRVAQLVEDLVVDNKFDMLLIGNVLKPGIKFDSQIMGLCEKGLIEGLDSSSSEEGLREFFNNKSADKILEIFCIENYELALRAMKIITDAGDKINYSVESKLARVDRSTLNPTTTLSMAVDLGNKIMLISIGDSIAFALDKSGTLIEESINTAHLDDSGKILKAYIGPYSETDTRPLDVSYENSTHKFEIRFLDKKDVGALILASDGAIPHQPSKEDGIPDALRIFTNTAAPRDLSDPRKIIHDCLKNLQSLGDSQCDKLDDKTIVAISFASQ